MSYAGCNSNALPITFVAGEVGLIGTRFDSFMITGLNPANGTLPNTVSFHARLSDVNGNPLQGKYVHIWVTGDHVNYVDMGGRLTVVGGLFSFSIVFKKEDFPVGTYYVHAQYQGD